MGEKIFRYSTMIFLPILLMMCFSLLKGVNSEVYSVGDGEGWNSEVDYVSWPKKYNFIVGDVLEFKYNKVQHNTFEVTEDTYRSCDTSSGVIAVHETGDDKVMLNESRKYWFLCNVSGHCLGGMRLGIDVKAGNVSPNNTNLQPNTSVNSATIYAFERWSLISLYSFAFAILLNAFY